jgi:glucokinase
MLPVAIAIDLGGTRVKMGLVTEEGILAKRQFASQSGRNFSGLLAEIARQADAMLAEAKLEYSHVPGIGISIPGIVDTDRKMLLSVNNKFVEAEHFDFQQWASGHFGLPVFIDNDARCALTGEWKYGAGTGKNDIVMVTLGTGVGGAALINGRLLRGKHYQAGCLCGHFVVDMNGPPCTCGNVGCVEAMASTWRLPALAREDAAFNDSMLAQTDLLDFEALFHAARQNDALANKLVDHCLKAWSAGVVTMIHAYDPELVIMGGGIMESGPVILPYIRKHVEKHAWTPWGKVDIVEAVHGGWSSMLGAAALALHQS